MTNTPSPTDEELIERGRRMSKAMYQYEPDHAPAQLLDKIIDRLESVLSDRAKLEEAQLAGTLSMSNSQVIADFDTREDAELFYERLAIVLLNRSTDRAT